MSAPRGDAPAAQRADDHRCRGHGGRLADDRQRAYQRRDQRPRRDPRGVEAAITALNYTPNRRRARLAGGEQIRIGLLYCNPSAAYLSEFLVGSLDQASRGNVQLVVENATTRPRRQSAVDAPDRAAASTASSCRRRCATRSRVLEAIAERATCPSSRSATGRAPDWRCSVSIDDYRAAYDMTRHIC